MPTLFLDRVDGLIRSHVSKEFPAELRSLAKHSRRKTGMSDLDLLVRTVNDDEVRRRDLFYCLDGSNYERFSSGPAPLPAGPSGPQEVRGVGRSRGW